MPAESFVATHRTPFRVLRGDVITAAVLIVVMLVFHFVVLGAELAWPSSVVGMVVQSSLFALRRTQPIVFAALTAVIAGIVVGVYRGIDLFSCGIAVLAGVYAVAAFAPARLRWAGLLSLPAALLLMVGLLLWNWFPYDLPEGAVPPPPMEPARQLVRLTIAIVLIVALYVTAYALGFARRGQLDAVQRERERADFLALDAHRHAELAVADERARIAREMHDIIAHSLASIVTLSEGGRLAARNNAELSATLFDRIAESGREALTDVKRLLRNVADVQDDEPARGVADIVELVERIRLAGQPIELLETGPRLDLPAGFGLAVFRVAQESLTNVLKHAPGAETSIVLRWGAERLDLVVTNTAVEPSDAAEGRGISGMRERTALFGGTLEIDQLHGRHRVHASWPLPNGVAANAEPRTA